MSVERIIAQGRAFTERLMTDTVRGVTIANGPLDESTGSYSQVETQIYAGPGRIKFANTQGRDDDDGGDMTVTQGAILSLPVSSSSAVTVGSVFEIVASASDPGNVGRRFRLTGIHAQTHATARRFQVEHYS